MPTIEEFAATFPTERVLQQALAKLLSRIPDHTGVQILQGNDELGKDIIFYTPAAFGKKDLNACVVKNTRITGHASTTTGARTVYNQAQQALDTTLLDENGHEQRVRRVFIITPHPIPPATTASICGALRSGSGDVQFVSGSTLLGLFKDYWPEYLADEYKLIHVYADALNQKTTAKELQGISFQYQLGTVDADIKKVYVKPEFHRAVHSYSLEPLLSALPTAIADRVYTADLIKRMVIGLRRAKEFIQHLVDWDVCDREIASLASVACDDLDQALGKAWSLALSSRAASASGAIVQAESFSARLSNVRDLNGLAQIAMRAVHGALGDLQTHLDNARQYVERPSDGLTHGLFAADERIYTMLDEMARTVGASCLREEGERQASFATSLIDEYAGALFLVAPAGFGKTSFCRWHALNDLDLLLQERTKTLPVYVPLHQLGRIDSSTDFRGAFLRHAGVSALLPKHGAIAHDRIRVYLDGLDEVASETTKRRIGQLAKEASDNDPSLQVIITARDYVFGPWAAWMPRLHLSGFGEKQVQELVANWLDHDNKRIALFFGQIDKVEALKAMMVIPLLATLIVLVFKQTGKLPENKTRLYEIFVDLHNGGWDLVKGIQRPSRFSAAEKMFVIKRIAARVHVAKRREILDDHCAGLAKDTLKKVEWAALKSELVRDGLILPLGGMVAFSHHSFQEFLTAKHLLGDPDQSQLNASYEKYLQGSDWWFEVLCFHIDLVGKPHEMRQWLDERLAAVCKLSSSYRAGAEARVELLNAHIALSFPYATGSV